MTENNKEALATLAAVLMGKMLDSVTNSELHWRDAAFGAMLAVKTLSQLAMQKDPEPLGEDETRAVLEQLFQRAMATVVVPVPMAKGSPIRGYVLTNKADVPGKAH